MPEDLQKALDQMNSNIDGMVKTVVDRFRKQAEDLAKDFENRKFDAELQNKIDLAKNDLNTDLNKIDQSCANLADLARQAKEAADKAAIGSSIAPLLAQLATQTQALQDRLEDFRTKTNTFAEKSGGFIASAAIKAISGGLV